MKITHDFHIHTRLSLCAGPQGGAYKEYIDQFLSQGLERVGFTDHFWDEKVGHEGLYVDCRNAGVPHYYKTQNFDHISQLKREIDTVSSKGIEVFFGAETEYDPVRRDVALSRETAERLDFVVVPNSHTHMIMPKENYYPYEKHRDFMVQAFVDIVNSPLKDKILAVAHPFYAVCCPYDVEELMRTIDSDTYKRIFTMAAESKIAIEINTSCVEELLAKNTPDCAAEHIRMFSLARACGAKLIFGSDAHSIRGHESYVRVCERAVELFEVSESDIAKLPTK
jgi:HisJ family histidinol phosphate phosphatase